jgi:hypothetical protein
MTKTPATGQVPGTPRPFGECPFLAFHLPSISRASVMKNWLPPWPAAAVVGTLALALVGWTSMALGHVHWPLVAFAPMLGAVLAALGACLLAYLVEDNRSIDAIAAVVLGFFVLSVVLFVGSVVLHLSLLVSGGACLGLLGLGLYHTRKRRPLLRLNLEPLGLVALLVAVTFTTLWSKQNLSALEVTPTTVTSTPWLDTLYHSIHISHFARNAGAAVGVDPLLSTAPLSPYHYGAYLIPSTIVRFTGLPAYISTVAAFAPLGTLFASLCAYSAARSLVGPLGGLLAVVFCLALPDPSFYLLENRWVSYFFFQQIASNGALGTALMALAWSFCFEGVASQRRRWTFSALVLGFCIVFFKSQLFLTYSFGLLLFAAATFPRLSRRLRVVLAALATALFLTGVFVVLPAIPRAPSLLPGTTAGPTNLHFALSNIAGACQACVLELGTRPALFMAIALPTFFVILFGALVPVTILLERSRTAKVALGQRGAWLLGATALNFAFLAVGLDINKGYGDAFEIAHKTFVWPYLALCIWCGASLAAWLAERHLVTRRIVLPLGFAGALLGLSHVVDDCAARLQTGFVYVGSETSSHQKIPREAYEAAKYIRESTARTAVIQLGQMPDNLMFAAIAERSMFVSYALGTRDAPAGTNEAQAAFAEILAAPNADEFRARCHKAGIGYFVVVPGQHPAWESELVPAFQSGEYRVFEI